MIPYGRQDITEEDIECVTQVLRSDWITQGPAIAQFENSVNVHCSSRYSVATSNATAALHVACLALSLNDKDILWTSPNTFVASANCGLYCGASVDFVDICPRTYNIDIISLKLKLEKASSEERTPKVLVAVHFSGQSCDMKAIHELSKKYNFHVIEDASHAIGGEYQNNPIGGCQYSDITVFSFHPVKIITTGEGGIATTNNEELAKRMSLFRSHGITRETSKPLNNNPPPWYYEQVELGLNYRMTDIQAALGNSQIKRLSSYVNRRRQLAEKYNQLCSKMPIITPWQNENTKSSWHLYVIRLKLDEIPKSRRQVFDSMRTLGIGVNVHYIPVHTQPYYQKLGFTQGMYPEAEKYYEEALSLPLFPTMTDEQQLTVVRALKKSLL